MQEGTSACVWLEPSAVEVRRDGDTASFLGTLGCVHIALSRSGLCIWMEISKDAFKTVGVLIGDNRPQSLVLSNEFSEQNAICSELLISSMVRFIRDGRWPECMKLISTPGINCVLPKLPPEISV